MPLLLAAALSLLAPREAVCRESAARLQRGPDAPAAVLGWYRALDAFLDSSDSFFQELELLCAAPTAASGRALLEGARSMAARYDAFEGGASAAAALEKNAAALEPLLRGLGAQDRLPQEARRLLFSLERGSLHHWALSLRQAALGASAPAGPLPPNALLTFPRGEDSTELPLLDLGQTSESFGLAPSPALRALLRAFGSGPRPSGAAALAWSRIWLADGPGRVYACLRSVQAGGEVRVLYEGGPSAAEQAAFYALAKTLVEGGFAVSVEEGVLRAFIDASRSRMDADSLIESFVLAARAAAATRPLAATLGVYLAGTVSEAENAARLDALARLRVAEGDLSFLPSDPKGFAEAAARHFAREGEREALRLGMSRTLSALRLEPFPPDPVGARTIRLHYNAPLEAGLARGEYLLTPAGVVLAPDYSPAAGPFQRLSAASETRLRPLLGSLRAVGRDGRGVLERGQWRLDEGRWLLLHLFHDAGRRGQGAAHLLVRGRPKQKLDLEKALGLLEETGLIGPAPSALPPASLAPRRAGAVAGRLLHGGPPVSARATYDPAKALLGDRILLTPYVSAGEAKALARAKGLVTTLGGAQSAALAAAFGVAAIDLPQARWTEASGIRLESPEFAPARPDGFQEAVVWKGVSIREGAALRLDPASATLELPEPARGAFLLRLEEALVAYDRGSGAEALALWVEGQLKGALPPARKRELVSALKLELSRRKAEGSLPEGDEALFAKVLGP